VTPDARIVEPFAAPLVRLGRRAKFRLRLRAANNTDGEEGHA
jgi:hypothetical protein